MTDSKVRCPGEDKQVFKGQIYLLSHKDTEVAYSNLIAIRTQAKQIAVKGEVCAIFTLRVPSGQQFAKRAVLCALWNRDMDGDVLEVWEPGRERIEKPGVFFAKCTTVSKEE